MFPGKHSSLTQKVKEKAHNLGFELVGVTTPDPPPHLDVYSNWLANSYHAGMAWMATPRSQERRANPLVILPECKSILVLGIRYPIPTIEENNTKSEGKIASYAWGDDYHDVLPPRLEDLAAYIEKLTGETNPKKWYTDTGPILEREFAQRAGLGWIGKNTCLINPKLGSYFLLAVILLGMELQIDEPITRDYCGTCTRCIEHCPTHCITHERMINANRCISYQTIENRNSIPRDLRPLIGDWIFGCDVCQQVCPWNLKFIRNSSRIELTNIHDPAFRSRSGIPPDSLLKEVRLQPKDFNRKFKGNPIKRTKRKGYIRNTAVALGNIGKKSSIQSLGEVLKDPEPLARCHAAWALGEIGGKTAEEILHQAVKVEIDLDAMEEIRSAMRKIKLNY